MASPSRGATDRILTFGLFSIPFLSGIVLVATTDLRADLEIRSEAGPDNTGWVQAQCTSLAPAPMSASVASRSVPAVSTISSTMKATLSLTSPMMCMALATLASSRRLSMMARGVPSRLAKARARSTPPASGEMTIRFGRFSDLM